MAEHREVYQRAVYYDVVFDRDVSREVDFIIAAYRRYAGGTPRSVLDIACGPGYHARACARRGLRAVGLDLDPEMIAFARDKAAAEGLDVTWIVADMRFFHLDVPVDVALSAFDGLDALLTNEDVIQHFRTVAQNLTPRGLYIVDLTHPRECSFEKYGPFHYVARRDGIEVEIRWGTNNPSFDLVTGVACVEVEMRVNDHGQEWVIRDAAHERLFFPQEIRLLAELSGALEVVGWYSDFDLNRPLDASPASRRMIAVLQKRTTVEEQPSTHYLSPKLEVRPHPEKGGFGLFAREPIRAGELLVVWGGKVVPAERFAQLPAFIRRYSLQIEEDLYLVPDRPGEPADFVNHSCDPNAGMSGQNALVAMRDIAPGEEVCYDYAMSDGSPYDEFDCHCGAPNCRGRVTGEDWRRPELWERYAGYFSPYLQRRIDRLRKGGQTQGKRDEQVGVQPRP